MKAKALLCVGESALRRHLAQALISQMPEVKLLEVGQSLAAHDLALAELPDALVIDANLPGAFDGLALLHRLRRESTFAELPMLVLVEAGASTKRHQAFFVGATDVMSLPIDAIEFALRMRVHLRHALRQSGGGVDAGPMHCGLLCLDPHSRSAQWPQGKAQLTPAEFAILVRLACKPGESVDAESLLVEALARRPGLGNPQLIHTHMRNLRRKLERDPRHPTLLVRLGEGYALRPEVLN